MVKKAFIAAAVVLAAHTLGCTTASPTVEPTRPHRRELTNGSTVNSELNGLLRVLGDVECTGFLITNQWAITARHCISSVLAAQPEHITVAFGGTRSVPAQTTTVAEVQRSPPGPDLALLRLSAPLLVQGQSFGYQQRAYPNYADLALKNNMLCAGWGSTGPSNPPVERPTGAYVPLDSVTPPFLELSASPTAQQIAAGDAGGFCSFKVNDLLFPAGVIAGLYTDGEGVAIDLTLPAIRAWVESTLVGHDSDIQANAASVPVAATPDGQEIDLFWIDGAGQMNGTRLSGFPLLPDPSPTVIGALSEDLFIDARPAAAYSSGMLHILAKTASGRVVDGVASGFGPVSTWTPVGVMPLVTGGLGVANRDTDRFDLFARSASGPVVHAWFSEGAWVSSELVGGAFDEDVLGVWADGTLHLYGVSLRDVFHKWGSEGAWNPGPTDWAVQNVTGNITSACAAVTAGDDTEDLLARIPNGHLGHKTFDIGWVDDFPDLGLPVPGEPTAIAAAGALHVFARNTDGSIWHAHLPR